MNRAMMIIALVALPALASFGYAPSKATFSTEDGRLMRVYIDGYLINQRPRQFVSVPRLQAGKHRVVLEVYGRRGRTLRTKDVIVLRPGLETRYKVRTRARRVALYKVGSRSLRAYNNRYRRPSPYERRRPVYQDRGYSCSPDPWYGY